MKPQNRILLFPGMGATASMYKKLCSYDRDIIACNWPKSNDRVSFGALAQNCISEYSISSDDIIAGSSMGGMIACEIFKMARCKSLVLVGSCNDPRSVPLHRIAWLGSYALHDRLINFSAASVPWGMRMKSSMLSDPNFVRWSLKAFSDWKGVQFYSTDSVFRIHGMLDTVIPAINIRPDKLIKSGGHLIAITHAQAVAKFITEIKLHANQTLTASPFCGSFQAPTSGKNSRI
jgi:surfactin synthase thioesterase subunit